MHRMTATHPSPGARRQRPTVDELAEGVRAGRRALLARAITRVESSRAEHRAEARELIERLLPHTGEALRVGITGVPGVGKSTFIESLGCRLADAGRRVAVLAIDPSSAVSGGSILGDKTRMGELSVHPNAYVRPSPTGGSLGGVAAKTRESLLLCEAAGFDVVLVETVGVGQSETMVAEMVDTVLLLLLPGAGDELQGIKRGILELIDVVAVNKADGPNADAARRARVEYLSALKLVRPAHGAWSPPVLTASGLHGDGLDAVWSAIEEHRQALEASGELAAKRSRQQLRWMERMVDEGLHEVFRDAPGIAERLATLRHLVADGVVSPASAAVELLERFRGARSTRVE